MQRRSVNKLVLAAVASAALAPAVFAQPSFPSRTIEIVVPYPPGGTTDMLARAVAEGMAKQSSVPVVVMNRAGGGSTIGAGHVGRAKPDGHTLLITTGSTATLIPYTLPISFDPLATLTSVAEVGQTPLLLYAHPSIPAPDLKGLIEWMKRNPGKISYGSCGAGTQGHFGGLILGKAAGVELTHVPFQGGAPALQALVGGHIELAIDAFTPAMEQVKAGRILALAVSSPERSPYAPDVPTFRELGYPEVEAISGFFGMFAPAGTPAGILATLNEMVSRIVATPEFQARLPQVGVLPPRAMSPAEMDASVRKDNAGWARFVKEIGFTPGQN
ncbi:MAG TPA: tripartite tricarboxylate transporter substrate binding protein [Burkholderiaceae bacterium]|nr:tripartite tricarboxylate transporter substrate binding protein [Burkholderiaceae bacterium]